MELKSSGSFLRGGDGGEGCSNGVMGWCGRGCVMMASMMVDVDVSSLSLSFHRGLFVMLQSFHHFMKLRMLQAMSDAIKRMNGHHLEEKPAPTMSVVPCVASQPLTML